MASRKYEVERSMFYTVGKDFAFRWMNENPSATKAQLIAAVLEGQKILPSGIAEQEAEKIAERVFYVIECERTGWKHDV